MNDLEKIARIITDGMFWKMIWVTIRIMKTFRIH